MHNSELGEIFFTTEFLRGLKHEIGNVVQSQVPDTVERAILLAKIQQQVLDKGKYKWNKYAASTKPSTPPLKLDQKGGTSTSPLRKERQTRDFLKANNLCFYCREPFDANHMKSCTKKPQNQLNALALNDMDVVLTEEVLNQLEIEDTLASDFCQLSLNALSGAEKGDAMKLRALVHNKVMLILINSGSSHSFISSSFMDKLGLPTQSTKSQQVRLANGDILLTDKMVPQLAWWCNGHTLHTDMKVLPMPVYDAILGFDWLQQNCPMQCN